MTKKNLILKETEFSFKREFVMMDIKPHIEIRGDKVIIRMKIEKEYNLNEILKFKITK